MLIRSEDAKAFDDWASDRFNSWLRLVFSPDHTHALRKDVVPFIPTEPLLDQMAMLYGFLSTDKQVSFRLGLTSAILDSNSSPKSIEIFEQLVHLVGHIEASDTIAALVVKIKEPAFLSNLSDQKADELFALVFNVVAGMAKTQEDGRLLGSLTESRRYKPEYDAMFNDALGRVPA